MVSLSTYRSLGRIYAWVMILLSIGVIVALKTGKDVTGTIIATVVDRLDIQTLMLLWFNPSNFQHVMLSLCAPLTQSIVSLVAVIILEVGISCNSLTLIALFELYFAIMSMIDFIVFIILFLFLRELMFDVSDVQKALYSIFAGWIVYVFVISWILRGVYWYVRVVNQPQPAESQGNVVVTEFVSVSAVQAEIRY